MQTSMPKIAVVTGANKGIGFAIVKRLLQQDEQPFHVYLTARDENRGYQAIAELHQKYQLSASFHLLDINCLESIRKFKDYLAQKHPSGIDLLVNNAGIYMPIRRASEKASTSEFDFDQENVKKTVDVNFFSTLNVCREFESILANNARIINISSGMGTVIAGYFAPHLKTTLETCSRLQDVVNLIRSFTLLNPSEYKQKGWLNVAPTLERWPGFPIGLFLAYGVSKIGLNVATKMLQQDIDERTPSKNVTVNACCPGNVRTDLNPLGTTDPDDAVDTPIYLALNSVGRGQFFADRTLQNIFYYCPPW